MEHNSVIKKNKLLIQTATCMDLTAFCRLKKAKFICGMILYTSHFQNGKITEMDNRPVVAKNERCRREGDGQEYRSEDVCWDGVIRHLHSGSGYMNLHLG